MREEKRIQAVIFDLDDTLIDWSKATISWREYNRPKFDDIHAYLTERGHRMPSQEQFAELMHHKNREVWEEAKKTHAGARFVDALELCFTSLGLDVDAIDMDEVMRVYNWTPIPGVVPYDDAHAVLEEIKARSYKIGLITNAYQPMWLRDIELVEYGLMKYLDARITSGDTGFMKPHPAIYWRMLGLLDLMPEQAVFVGDRPANDILGAHNVGMTAVLMSPPHLDYDLDGVTPDYTITTLSELLPVLEALDSEGSL